MNEYVAIQLSPIDAKLFLKFQKHHALIGLLESIGAFDLKDGSIKIHFDHIGQIRAIDKHESYTHLGLAQKVGSDII